MPFKAPCHLHMLCFQLCQASTTASMDLIHTLLQYFWYAITHPILFLYQILQYVLDKVLSPTPPPPRPNLAPPKIAVIGAGLSAASHIVGHGFDYRIFEVGPKENLGGIWSKVNNTSGLQIHSIMYLFIRRCTGRRAIQTANRSYPRSPHDRNDMASNPRQNLTLASNVFTKTHIATKSSMTHLTVALMV